jgi:hypothetical protein
MMRGWHRTRNANESVSASLMFLVCQIKTNNVQSTQNDKTLRHRQTNKAFEEYRIDWAAKIIACGYDGYTWLWIVTNDSLIKLQINNTQH